MSNVKGRVDDVYSYDTSYGTMYGMVVDGQKYGLGKTKPRASAGDYVSFAYTTKGNFKNVDTKTFTVEAGTPTPATPSENPSPSNSGTGYSSDTRQNSIVRQSSLEYAIRFLSVLVAAEAVPGVTKTMKAEDRYNILQALLVETADEFFDANIAGRSLGAAVSKGTEAGRPDSGDSSENS